MQAGGGVVGGDRGGTRVGGASGGGNVGTRGCGVREAGGVGGHGAPAESSGRVIRWRKVKTDFSLTGPATILRSFPAAPALKEPAPASPRRPRTSCDKTCRAEHRSHLVSYSAGVGETQPGRYSYRSQRPTSPVTAVRRRKCGAVHDAMHATLLYVLSAACRHAGDRNCCPLRSG